MKNLIKLSGLYFLMLSIILHSCKKTDDTVLPTVKTYSPKYIASTMAVVGCTVESDGGSDIIDCGIYMGISQDPQTSGTKFQMGSDTGIFLGQVKGLLPSTQYFIMAYAENAKGENLGEQVNFTTTETIKDYDNNLYETVKIGNQFWMAKNLKTTRYLNGDLIATTTPSSLNITSETSPKYQWSYNGDDANNLTYGKLYTWYAITDSRKACPSGWHVPTDAEWTTLETTLGGYTVAASKLKEAGNTHWLSPYNSDATNESCFSGLPGGYRDWSGSFYLIQNDAYWWSSSESEAVRSWSRTMNSGSPSVGRSGVVKSWGLSVRCLKD